MYVTNCGFPIFSVYSVFLHTKNSLQSKSNDIISTETAYTPRGAWSTPCFCEVTVVPLFSCSCYFNYFLFFVLCLVSNVVCFSVLYILDCPFDFFWHLFNNDCYAWSKTCFLLPSRGFRCLCGFVLCHCVYFIFTIELYCPH